jgi:hypothetical protein
MRIFSPGRDLEAATQHQLSLLLLDEDEAQAQLPRDFLADDEAAHRGRNHRDCPERLEFGRQRRAEFFHDRHLLQREGALKELPAVQTAAQDENALRAARRCRGKPGELRSVSRAEFQVSSFKFQDVLERRCGVHLRGRFFSVVSAPLWLISAVPKWVKFIIAVLLLPVCVAAGQTLWQVMRACGSADTHARAHRRRRGVLAGIYLLLPKPMWIYVFGHELTHVLWVWLFGGSVKKFKVTSNGGHVIVDKTNFIIALSPVFLSALRHHRRGRVCRPGISSGTGKTSSSGFIC